MRLTFLFLFLSLTGYAQTRDSVYAEIAAMPATAIDSSKRARKEQQQLKRFLLKSRREVTMIEFGMFDPSYLFVSSAYKKSRQIGFGVGINQKITPSWGIRGVFVWRPANTKNEQSYHDFTDGLWAQAAVDYYPFIQQQLRKGKTANNFYNQPFVTLDTWWVLVGQKRTESATGQVLSNELFDRSLGLGIGVCSSRNRWYFYRTTLGMAYWDNRSDVVRHPIQPVWTIALGFAL